MAFEVLAAAHERDCECRLCEGAREVRAERWPLVPMTAEIRDPTDTPAFLKRQAE